MEVGVDSDAGCGCCRGSKINHPFASSASGEVDVLRSSVREAKCLPASSTKNSDDVLVRPGKQSVGVANKCTESAPNRRPNSSEALYLSSDAATSRDARVDFAGESSREIRATLLAHDKRLKNWRESLYIEQDDGTTCDASCACNGKASTTPIGAKDQPSRFPPGTCFRLPTSCKGVGDFDKVKALLQGDGPKLVVFQTPHPSRKSSYRKASYSVGCPSNRVDKIDDSAFEDGKTAKKGIRKQPKLRTKSQGSRLPGIKSMHSKTVKKSLAPGKRVSRVPTNRTTGIGAKNAMDRCPRILHVFVSEEDDYWYITSSSNLHHKGHPEVPPSAKSLGLRDISEEDAKFIAMAQESGVENAQIAKLMTRMKGEEAGTYLPRTIYNMSKKSKEMADLAKGTKADMSDAEKTLAGLRALGISHVVVYHDPANGFMTYFSKSKGNPPMATSLTMPHLSQTQLDQLNDQMREIRLDLGVRENSKILLLLSIATDDMIRQVAMHPHVWFVDVTAGVNKQKKDWFIMAIRTPAGKTFPGNLTVIPSGRRWVFSTIYQFAFVKLYGELTCSRNRLVLSDEDNCQYGPFEDAIATNNVFKNSALMICIFHGIWMSFKEKVFKYLPHKDDGSKELTDDGLNYGNFFYTSLVHQSSLHVSKVEYDRSQIMLSKFLAMPTTVGAVGRECVEAMKLLQENLCLKERHLANYMRLGILMNWCSKTTSPTESLNNLVKHGIMGVNSTMNGSKTLSLMTQATDERALLHRKEAIRQLGKANRASRSPTEDQIQVKIQYMIDVNFDGRLVMKVAQIGPEEWLSWDFTEQSSKKFKCAPWPYLPRFHRVFRLRVRRFNGQLFLSCSCRHHDDCGFAIIDEMTHDQVSIELWKIWEPYYGPETNIGRRLMEMQQAQFENECMGIPITDEQLERMKSKMHNGSLGDVQYPLLYPGTSEEDYAEAQWVLERADTKGTVYGDLDQHRLSVVDDSIHFDSNCGSGFDVVSEMQDTETFLSESASRLQDALDETFAARSNANVSRTDLADYRKEAVTTIDDILKDPRATNEDIQDFIRALKEKKTRTKQEILARDGYHHEGAHDTSGKRKREPADDDAPVPMHWAGIDCNDSLPERRMKGVAG